MKRKVFSVLVSIFLLMAGFVFSACGDKYQNLEFNIQYAYSENDAEWLDGNNGIFLNYGREDDKLQLTNGSGKVFVRVQIKNVNEKDIGQIYVSNTGGLSFNNKIASADVAFEIPINGNATTKLKFTEINSNKQKQIDFTVHQSLTAISANNTIAPATIVEGQQNVDLTSFNNLIFTPDATLTNQTQVTYTLVAIGKYEGGEFVPSATPVDNIAEIVDFRFLNLRENFKISPGEYVLKVRATSVYHEDISTETTGDVDILIVDKIESGSESFAPTISFNNGIKIDDSNVVDLYLRRPTTDLVTKDYSTTTLKVDVTDFTSQFTQPQQVGNFNVQYKLAVKVDDQAYLIDAGSSVEVNGLKIENRGSNIYSISASQTNLSSQKLTFFMQLCYTNEEGELIGAENNLNYEKTITITKQQLVEQVMVNSNFEDFNIKAYQIDNADYLGAKLTVEVDPSTADTENSQIYLTSNASFENFEFTVATGSMQREQFGDGYILTNGTTIYVKFVGNTPSQKLIFSTRTTPSSFEGVEVAEERDTITVTVNKSISANKFEMFSKYEGNTLYNEILNTYFVSNSIAQTFYLKVYHDGSTLAENTIKLTSSNSAITFDGKQSIYLTDAVPTALGITDETGKTYSIYAITLKATRANETANINIAAVDADHNDAELGINLQFVANSVNIVGVENEEDFSILPHGFVDGVYADAIKLEEENTFAIKSNTEITFDVLGKGTTSSNYTNEVVEDVALNLTTTGVNFDISKTSKSFSLYGYSSGKFGEFQITISYYILDSAQNLITLSSTRKTIKILVYNNITDINLVLNSDTYGESRLTYVNDDYVDARTKIVTFNTNSNFTGGIVGEEYNNVSQLKIEFTTDASYSVYLLTANGQIKLNSGDILKDNNGANVLSGKIKVQLNSKTNFKNITIRFTAWHFGLQTAVRNSETIAVADYEPVEKIELDNLPGQNTIVQTTIDSYSIYLSFLGAAVNTSVSAQFKAIVQYATEQSNLRRFPELVYNIYPVELDANGDPRLVDGKIVLGTADNNKFLVSVNADNVITISATKGVNAGGLFQLVISAKDSQDDLGNYLTNVPLMVRISDGTTQNRYVLNNQNFNLINTDESNLSAHYVLGEDINLTNFTPIGVVGESVFPFTGSLSGTTVNVDGNNQYVSTTRHKISLTITDSSIAQISQGQTTNRYAGLFAEIGASSYANLLNFDLEVAFNITANAQLADGTTLFLGGLAAVNNGQISNVNVVVLSGTITITSGNLNFGIIAGHNAGNISLTLSSAVCNANVNFTISAASTHKIGGVAGLNSGVISGGYNGKASLNAVSYSVLNNFAIAYTNTSTDATFNIGGVAGENAGNLTNLIVGGRISLTDEYSKLLADEESGIGGVAGKMADADGITKLAVLALDIENNTSIATAGIVARSEGATISDVRFISAQMTYNSLTNYGKIEAKDVAAGIVVYSNDDTIELATVENFITSLNGATFYTFNAPNVAGLIYSINNSTIATSFINANVNTESLQNAYLTVDKTDNATDLYFIGSIKNVETLLSKISVKNTPHGYAFVYDNNQVYVSHGESALEQYNTASKSYNLVDSYVNANQQIYGLMIDGGESTDFDINNYYLTGSITSGFTLINPQDEYDLPDDYFVLTADQWAFINYDMYYRAKNSDGNLTLVNGAPFNPNNDYFKAASIDVSELYVLENGQYVKNTAQFDINKKYYERIDMGATWQTDVEGWFDGVNLLTDPTWRLTQGLNSVNVDGFDYYLPYLIKDNQPIMVIYPQSIAASFDEAYTLKTNSIVVDNFSISTLDSLTKVMIVNYFESEANTNNSAYNIHNIQKTNQQDGLVNLSISPNEENEISSQGGILFEIIEGNEFATILNNQQISFRNGPSGKQPIVVKCSSIFNSSAVEYVVFYTQPLASNLTVAGSGVTRSDDGFAVDVNYLNNNSKTTLTVGAENIYSGQNFLNIFNNTSLNLPLKLNVVNNSSTNILSFSTTKQELTFEVDDLIGNDATENVTVQLCLNLSYFGDDVVENVKLLANKVVEIDGQKYLVVKETEITFNIYSSTSKIVVTGGPYRYSTEHTITFTADQYTGYVGTNPTDSFDINGYVDDDGYYCLAISGADSIKLEVVKATESEPALDYILKQTKKTYITELFDFVVDRAVLYEEGKIVGFKYTISASLKNEFNYRYIEVNSENPSSEFTVLINVIATSNSRATGEAKVTFYGSELASVRIDNYSATSRTTSTPYVNLIENSTKTSSIISPSGYGGVMILHLEPSYANVSSAILSTKEPIYPPTYNNGAPVYFYFTQLVYNKATSSYQTYYSPTGQQQLPNNGGIALELITGYDENGAKYYDGTIYVHTRLTGRFSGYMGEITANLQVNTTNGKSVNEQKTLLTQYLPGVSFDYAGKTIEDDGGYALQMETENEIVLKVDGYQYNSNPSLSFAWYLTDNSIYSYVETDSQFDIGDSIIDSSENRRLYENNINKIYLLKDGKYIQIYNSFKFNGRDYRVESFEDLQAFYNELTNEEKPQLKIYDDRFITKNDVQDVQYDVTDGYITYYADANVTTEGNSHSIKYYFNLHTNILASVRVNATLSLTTENETITSNYASIILHPVDYIINSAIVNDVANGVLTTYINQDTPLDLTFSTFSNLNLTAEIWQAMLNQPGFDPLSMFYYLTEDGNRVYLNDEQLDFSARVVNNRIIVSSAGALNRQIYLKFGYKYELDENGLYKIKFYKEDDSTGLFVVPESAYSFTLNVLSNTSENGNLIAISKPEDLNNLQPGVDYILVNNITVENFEPITTNIASLDGNNRVIKIKSFNITANKSSYGLFATLSSDTILKNVVVDYSEYGEANRGQGIINLVDAESSTIYFGGLVAQNNGGLIYNCDVINLSASERTITIISNSGKTLYFGGLVAQNTGVITNSRVGKAGNAAFKEITYSNGVESVLNKQASGLTFVLGSENSITNNFVSIAGGFVGTNSGTISNCYFANSSLINYSTSIDASNPESAYNSKVAGFVAENNGSIAFSYVRAKENNLTLDTPLATGAKIESKSNGIVAGFVFYNTSSASITNAFANTVLLSDSDFMAGFVYNNAGIISEAYAACTLNNKTNNDNSEQPFIGINERNGLHNLSANAQLINTYYYSPNGTGVPSQDLGINAPAALSKANFQNADALTGFVFIESGSRTQRQQGVWSYYNENNELRALPELIGANTIAYSHRIEASTTDAESNFVYSPSYMQGSVNNPYIIRSAAEFNNVMTSSNHHSFAGYVRFINNIDFETLGTNNDRITTRLNFVLGDANQNRITSIEGNGMTISGIFLNPLEAGAGDTKIGLFSEIEFAYVKNLNLVIDSVSNSLINVRVRYSGGLAGKINNSTIINVILTKANTNSSIVGYNFAGALAGMITGNSMLYGIDANINVTTVQSEPNTIYNYLSLEEYLTINNATAYNREQLIRNYNNTYLANLSYAGGIAGVIDINEQLSQNYNISYVDVYGSDYSAESDGSISGEFAGGVAGYAGTNTKSFKVKYYIANSDKIRGKVVGGLYAICKGHITACQVTKEEGNVATSSSDPTGQHAIDSAFANFIIQQKEDANITKEDALSNMQTIGESKTYGNLELLGNVDTDSCYYAGGLIGVGIGAIIDNCYSKASFSSGNIIGGLVGLAVGNSITYSYAVPYVASKAITDGAKIGGLIGAAINSTKAKVEADLVNAYEHFEDYIRLNSKLYNADKFNQISYTFSTVFVDNDKNENIANIDYLCGNKYVALSSNNNVDQSVLSQVYVGEHDIIGAFSESNNIKIIQLVELLDSSAPNQQVVFNNVFSSWMEDYWTFNRLRFYPILTADNTLDEHTISSTHGENSFDQLKLHPDWNYVVKDNIDMAGWIAENNWIFDVEFTGSLRGEMGDSKATPKIYNLQLFTTTDDTSGLFRKTTGARISNLEFVWNDTNNSGAAVTINNNISSFGGLSAEDNGSTFTNVTVHSGQLDAYNSVIPMDGSMIKVTVQGSISNFGGIVGKATASSLTNNTFSSKVEANFGSSTTKNIGGIVGQALSVGNDSTSIQGAVLGINERDKAIFNITSTGAVNLGAVVGNAQSTAIQNCNVGQNSNITFEATAKLIGNSESYISGLVGSATGSVISGNNVFAKITALSDAAENRPVVNVAGLIGYYNLNTNIYTQIENNTTWAEINVGNQTSEAVFTAANLSTGIATIVAGTTIKINQNVFAGKILTTSSQVATIRASAAVANKQGSDVVINELTTSTDIAVGDNSTSMLYVGEIVAYADKDVAISNALASGKIVPASDGYRDSLATHISIGGMVGEIGTNLKIDQSISIASIVSGGLNPSVYDVLDVSVNIQALIGVYSALEGDLTNVFYSSDFALQPEKNAQAYNIPAQSMFNAQMFANFNLWASSTHNKLSSGMPYLINLKTQLERISLLTNNRYLEGSPLAPIVVSGANDIKESETNYYLLSSNLQNLNFNINILNGVLIGGECEYSIASRFINDISAGSAVSNLHFKLNGEFNANSTIAQNNHGVIFNSSISGTNITAHGPSGMLAYNNYGLISYCANSSEIVSANSTIAGITYSNSGTIMSSYFTGYINSTSQSAGIVMYNEIENNKGYLFNNYVAGVVNNIAQTGNSFVGDLNSLQGKNNFIDKYANNEENIEGVNTAQLNVVDSIDLLAGVSLKGNWFTSIKKSESNYSIDVESHNFGYNYLYPVYNFNRRKSENIEEFNYQLYLTYTGTGTDKNIIQTIDDVINYNNIDENGNYKIKASGLTNESNIYAANAFKIPHLGVLKAVEYLANINGTHTNLNYMFIYDIDGQIDENTNINWDAIGAEENHQFNGYVFSNKLYNYNSRVYGTGDLNTPLSNRESLVIIKNLNGNGLFTNINKAHFEYLRFGNFTNLTNSGALGVDVVGENDGANRGSVSVNQIYFDNSTISGSTAENNYIAALFGKVSNNNVSISNLFAKINTSTVTLKDSSLVGLIAGNLSSGTITLTATSNTTSLSVNFGNGVTTAGGIVGEIDGGTVDARENTITIYSYDGVNLGGIVGKVSDISDGSATVQNVKLKFETQIHAKSFGVFANNIGGTITFNNCAIDENSNVAISTTETEDVFFGVVAAQQTGGKATVTNTSMNQTFSYSCSLTDAFNPNNDSQGFGGLIGKQIGGEVEYRSPVDITINVLNGQNLGGAVGYYADGSISLSDSYNITLQGTSNVGGLFGYANAFNIANFIGHDNIKATLNTRIAYGGATTLYNWGGLFGVLNNPMNIDGINNGNAININTATANDNITLFNVGGIAGLIQATDLTLTELTNNGAISSINNNSSDTGYSYLDGNNEIYKMSVQGSLYGRNLAIKAVNMGGIFGRASGITINGAINNAQIKGYQNVGGIIGYANNVILTGEYSKPQPGEAEDIQISIFTPALSTEGAGQKFSLKNGFYTPVISPSSTDNLYELGRASSTNNVVGVVNVGGLIGQMQNGKLNALYSQANVYGNVNVGGAVGNLVGNNSTTITNVIVLGQEQELLVKGIIFAEFVENLIASEEEVERLEVNFFPTGVGGLVGNAQTGSIHHNYLGNVLVTSASEGASSGMSANNVTVSSTVISTVGNYMADLTKLSANSNAVYDYSSSSQQTGAATQFNKVSFNAIASGFGGVFGTTNSTVVGAVADATLNITGNPIINNYLNNTNVSASLGVNTGSFYGFVNNGESPTIATPSLMDNISVDGAYNVGGVVGNYTANALNGFSASSINRLAGVNKVSINVQTNNITGMYVGGLFGKVNVDNGEGDASNLVITSNSSAKISINTNNSYYIGGLIGRLEGNLRGEDASSSTYNSRVNCSADGSGSSVGLEISGSDVENFGGLVGMLKVAPNANGITAEVTGAHQFAFTVNTIENSNYYDGPSTYDYNDERSAELDLVAQAYYVNKDSFNISASKDATLYDGENDCNPLLQNTGAWGWHKTYTGFKTLQRIIPAGVGANYSGTNEWDAIQPIYDATNITHVGTLKELVSRGLLKENDIILVGSHNALLDAEKIDYGKVITDETGKIKVIQSNKDGYPEEKDGSNIEICDEDFINFTVYEDESGHPKLYSRLGVGTVYVNDKNQFATPVDEKKKITERADGEISKYYIDLNNSKNYTQALHYLYWGERKGDDFNNKKFITVGGQEVNMVTNPTEEKYLVYKIKTAFYSQYAETDSASTDKANDVYFQFDVIYSNYSSPDDVADDVLPVDGSIFNVVGVQTTAARNKIKSENDNLQWLRWVLEVVSWIETAIVGLAALGALLTLFIPGVQFVGFGVLGALLGLGGGLVYGSIYTHQWRKNSVTYKSVQQTYINRADQSNGFLSSTYRRQVQYDGSGDNWIMQTADFSCILINGYYYQNYSCERPSDYYSARYTIVASNLQTDYPEGKYLAHLPDLSNDASYQISYWDAKGEKITETDNYAAAVGWIICDKNIELGNSLTPNLLDGKNCALIMKTYEYNNGVYYRCVNTSEMAYYPTQMFNANLYADADGYINYNGSIFVKGTFNGPDALRPYTMDDTNNFLHYDAAGKLTINNKEWTPRSSDSNEAKCDDLTLEFRAQNQLNLAAATADSKNKIGSSLKITNTAANHGTIEEVTTSYNENDEPTGEIYNEGFSFMRNAYYTASGKHINKYISTNNYQTIDPIVAAFIGPTTVQPEGVEGVDYLQYNASYTITDEEGHQQNRVIPIFYTFNGKATNQSGVDYVKNETKLGILNSDGSIINENSTIYINTYPDSFVNPYKDTDKGSDMHDENYYIDLAILDANVEEIDQSLYLQYDATYFYYEGGYVTKEDDDSANKTVFMPIENEYYYTNSQLGSVGSRTYTFTYSYIEIDIYDKNGNKQTTGTGVNNAFTLQDLVNGWDKYKDYYLEDVSKLNYSDQLKEMYKVSNNFYVNGNKANFTSGYSESGIDGDLQDDQGTHAPNVPYTIAYLVNSSFVVHNGVLSSMVTKYYSANGMNYNSNKYLANDKYQIYTRYKFVKNEKSDLNPFASGVWCYEGKLSDEKPKYYLFVKGKLPNAGLTTNLVESVVITFAAKGKTIYIGDMQNGLQGQFTSEIKIH